MEALDFNFDINLVQSQKLLLTPQLKQALEILRMNCQELSEYVQEQLEVNPVLELVEDEGCPDEDSYVTTIEQVEWEDEMDRRRGMKEQEEEISYHGNDMTVDRSSVRLSLKEHLLFQLHTSGLDEDQILIGEYLIGNIDENGYLAAGIGEVAQFFNIPASRVNRVLEHIQTFDPPGICARNLKECLLIQLRQMGDVDPNVITVVEKHLDNVASNKVTVVAKSMGLDHQRVTEIFDFIKTLEPKPGREFGSSEDIKYITPDVIVKEMKNKFEVLINEDSLPLLNVNEYYRGIISEDIGSETRKFIQNKIDSATWLIKCIEQRKNTTRKIAECIVGKQAEFFGKGKNHLRPLTMKAIAREVGMHESTVSRTVNGKYIQCAWGIFEMRYFFTGRISASSGEEVSTENIKARLKSVIKEEDKRNPLSDSDIAEILQKEGLEISRRTVAKYRAEMGIPVVSQRKRY